ncbi:MAG: hypothetical protein KJ621_21115 [Proteobacteria bacterium]|nr:hypothetical protein [Pseudomonadota bacterium]
MKNIKLSEHFDLFEMTITEHRKFLDLNRTSLTPELIKIGEVLCETLLEPIRNHFASPLIIHSGYRHPKLNKAVKGSSSSQHCLFQSADFHIVGVTLKAIFTWVRFSSLSYGQVILEGWSLGNPSWVHISLGEPYRDKAKCKQVLTFDGKNYIKVI